MCSILELAKTALIGKQIKIYVHRMTSPIPLKASPMEWDYIDIERPSDNYLIRTIVDIEYCYGDYDRWDGCELILNEPLEVNGKECSITINYTTKFDLLHVQKL